MEELTYFAAQMRSVQPMIPLQTKMRVLLGYCLSSASGSAGVLDLIISRRDHKRDTFNAQVSALRRPCIFRNSTA